MANEDRYTREARKEKVKIDKDNLDLETTASICAMIQETLYNEAKEFTDVIEKLTKTYKKEFAMGEFSVCIAVSDSIHDEPTVSLVTGSIPSILKNFKFMSKGVKEILHNKATD